ncbi:MAG: hypothetical protein U0790_22010 [Isosphaeraceae bacterium]
MRFVRYLACAGFAAACLGFPMLLSGCGSSVQEGTMVERTPEQIAGEQASMKGMMEAMKATQKKR